MKAPWFPFYTGDFLASATVQDMEAHEVGAYVLLLARSWQSDTPGYIEDDEYAMRRAARLSADVWAECKNALLKKWPVAEDKPGYRFNPRLKKEADKQVELRELKAEAGRKSAERRAALATQGQQKANTNPTPVEIPATGVEQKGNYSQPQPQPQSTTVDEKASAPQDKAKLVAQTLTDPADEQHWSVGPLTKPLAFKAIADRLGFEGIDLEHYRKQALVAAEDGNISRTIAQWNSWVRNFFNNQMKNGPLIKASVNMPTAPTPKDKWAEINTAGGVIAFDGSPYDEVQRRMKVENFQRHFPNATIHAILPRR